MHVLVAILLFSVAPLSVCGWRFAVIGGRDCKAIAYLWTGITAVGLGLGPLGLGVL
jgi:hypothetical protein